MRRSVTDREPPRDPKPGYVSSGSSRTGVVSEAEPSSPPGSYDGAPGRACSDRLAGVIVSTGQGAVWITYCATEPSIQRTMPDQPWVPMTMRSAAWSWAWWTGPSRTGFG
jgi:hypothetical protein